MPINKVICGDTLQILPTLRSASDKKVVIITDPVWPNSHSSLEGWQDPYGIWKNATRHFPNLAKTIVVVLGCSF